MSLRWTPTVGGRHPHSRSRPAGPWSGATLVLLMLLTLLMAGLMTSYLTSARELTATVQGKERVCDSTTGECRYLAFTDEGVFQVVDTIVFRRFDSSDVYGRLRVEDVYDLRVVGWRIPVLSRYPNILDAELR